MIKKIPIKGITRDPSGQISSDGFCAESLNVQLDMGEVAPAIKPRPATDAAGNPLSVEGDILFIHKGIGYENAIYRAGSELRYAVILPKGEAMDGLVYGGFEDGEEINDITTIGNTVIVSSTKDMYYILWKEGAYRFLGNQIPVPSIGFRMQTDHYRGEIPDRPLPTPQDAPSYFDGNGKYKFWGEDAEILITFYRFGADRNLIEGVSPSTSILGKKSNQYRLTEPTQQTWLDTVWGIIDEKMAEMTAEGKIVFPIFVRYAVRLYDGTSYAQSIPVLIGGDISHFIKIRTGAGSVPYGDRDESSGEVTVKTRALIPHTEFRETSSSALYTNFHGLYVDLAEPYKIVAEFGSNSGIFDGWEDIVTGVDLFTSTPMAPQRDAVRLDAIPGFYAESEVSEESPDEPKRFVGIFNGYLDPHYMNDRQEDLLRLHQITYLSKSYTLDEFNALSGDVVLDDLNFSSDYIMAQEALKETPQSMHHNKGNGLFNYNKRLLMTDTEQVLYGGYPFIHSSKWNVPSNPTPARYGFVFYLRGENGENIVVTKNLEGGDQITARRRNIVDGSPELYEEFPTAWFAYPDSRCYRMEVYMYSWQTLVTSFQMRPLDQADVAYAFIGFGQQRGYGVAMYRPSENNLYKQPNTLLVSKANNPFIFPVEDSVTFTAGEVLNLAVANVPLSEGQAGQFPLYVFTDEGVFAMTVDADGKLRTSHNVSRDILLSRNALVGIEQGVFFSAARGLLLLQGSRVTDVSSQMDGWPESMGDPLLGNAEELLGFSVDGQHALRTFLSDCFLAYDYANTRIIIFNPEYDAQYVYKFDTQSWHRLQTPFGKPVRALNSFPEAQVVMKGGNRQSVLDFSVPAEDGDAEPLPGLVYTRDIDIDSADIYKTISRLEVRGRFRHGHVRWQLQGSNDGINYRVIHSLRGPSWKWYRIALVTMLGKDERVSYIEIDYTPKFTDRIR